MIFLFKTILLLVAILVIGGLVVNNVPSLKQSALEFINPSVKEGRLLANIASNLNNLEISVTQATTAKTPAEAKTQLLESKKLVSETKNTLEQIKTINQKQQEAGLISQALNKIADTFIDKTSQIAQPPSLANTQPSQTCRP